MACARALLMAKPGLSVTVLEKERSLAQHQSGRSSNVLHAGVYYEPGSLRARLCAEGRAQMVEYCDARQVPYDLCGKLIVATDKEELPRLEALFERGKANGVPGLRLLHCQDEIAAIEPNIRAVGAIHSPFTGIVDYKLVTEAMARDFESLGGKIRLGVKLEANSAESILAPYDAILNCGGLYADRIAHMLGGAKSPELIPVRGDYCRLDSSNAVRGLVYPVPNPALPFLGIHVHKTVTGHVECGPNAMLAFSRQGYRFSDFNIGDLVNIFGHLGFWKLFARNKRWAAEQLLSSASPEHFAEAVRRFLPNVPPKSVSRSVAGVRALAIDELGNVIDDFVHESTVWKGKRVVNIRNAPSPAATSSLALARLIVQDVCLKHFF